jgi:signal transduction histidine kinase
VTERLRTTRVDATLAVAFVAVGLVQVVLFPIAGPGLGELFVIASTLPLAWRRTYPVQSSLVASASWLIPLDGFTVLGFVVVILQFFALGTHGTPRRAAVLVAVWASVVSVVGTLLGPEAPVAAIGGVLVVVAPFLAGVALRREQHQKHTLAVLAAELRDERARAEEAAVGAERARIAQELHDVVGHEVTLIAIQAEAAAAALRTSPVRAAEPVEAIRTTAHRTLAEIRAVLGVLAPCGDGAEPRSESPSELAERARAAGIDCVLTVTGTAPPDHAPVSLAVSRIVRECLTNAGRHAPGQPVSIAVNWSADCVTVRSANRRTAPGRPLPGRGLSGIRHRAELLGGSYKAAITEDRFEIEVQVPVERIP